MGSKFQVGDVLEDTIDFDADKNRDYLLVTKIEDRDYIGSIVMIRNNTIRITHNHRTWGDENWRVSTLTKIKFDTLVWVAASDT